MIFYTSFSIHKQEIFFRNRKLKLIKYLYLGFEYDLYLMKLTKTRKAKAISIIVVKYFYV